MSSSDVREVIINGFKSAFQPYRTRQDMLMRAVAEMDVLIRDDADKYKATTGEEVPAEVKRDRRGTSQKIAERRATGEHPAIRHGAEA